MTAVMQSEAEASKGTVAERELKKAIEQRADLEALTLAKVVLNEHLELLASKEPNGQLHYQRAWTAQAEWAITVLAANESGKLDIPAECKDTRMYLCGIIINGWIMSNNLADERNFARAIRDWPVEEADEVSKLIRKHFDASTGILRSSNVARKLGTFFAGCKGVSKEENTIFRQVFKSIGHYANMEDLLLLGQGFFVLQGSDRHQLTSTIFCGVRAA